MIRRDKPLRATLRRRRGRWVVPSIILLAFLAVSLAGGALYLAQGPVSVPQLARAIEERVSTDEAQLTIGVATVDVSRGLPVRIELENAAIEMPGTSPVTLILPRISAPLDLSDAMRGEVVLEEVVLEQPKLQIQIKLQIKIKKH